MYRHTLSLKTIHYALGMTNTQLSQCKAQPFISIGVSCRGTGWIDFCQPPQPDLLPKISAMLQKSELAEVPKLAQLLTM